MKILAMIILVLLILAVCFVGYVYKKNAMFLPALFGIGGFPNIKKEDYYQADGTSGKRKKMIKWHFLCSIRCLAAISICFLMLRITC